MPVEYFLGFGSQRLMIRALITDQSAIKYQFRELVFEKAIYSIVGLNLIRFRLSSKRYCYEEARAGL